jgi:hypothetical protein
VHQQTHGAGKHGESSVMYSPLKITFQKRADLIAYHKFERRFAQRIVPAWHYYKLVIEVPLPNVLDDLARIDGQKCRIVSGVEEERFLREG